MKIKQTFGFFIGVAIGVCGCQVVNSFRQEAVVRLNMLHTVYSLAAVYFEHEDFFYRIASSSLDNLIIGSEKYSRFLTANENQRKQKLYNGIFRLRQAHPPVKSENAAYQWYQDQANLILKQNCEGTESIISNNLH